MEKARFFLFISSKNSLTTSALMRIPMPHATTASNLRRL